MQAVLDLSGVAKIVRIPIIQARNWTSGRPLRIGPSVRAAIGKGSRNLYDETDLLKFAVAHRLRQHGIGFKLIKYVVAHVSLSNFKGGGRSDLLILHTDGERIYHEELESNSEELPDVLETPRSDYSHISIRLSSLVQDVIDRIECYVEAQDAEEAT